MSKVDSLAAILKASGFCYSFPDLCRMFPDRTKEQLEININSLVRCGEVKKVYELGGVRFQHSSNVFTPKEEIDTIKDRQPNARKKKVFQEREISVADINILRRFNKAYTYSIRAISRPNEDMDELRACVERNKKYLIARKYKRSKTIGYVLTDEGLEEVNRYRRFIKNAKR